MEERTDVHRRQHGLGRPASANWSKLQVGASSALDTTLIESLPDIRIQSGSNMLLPMFESSLDYQLAQACPRAMLGLTASPSSESAPSVSGKLKKRS